MDLEQYHNIVEQALAKMGLNPADCRKQAAGQWNIQTGDLEVWIDIITPPVENTDAVYFQVMAPFAQLPDNEKKEAFLLEMLSLNYQMVDASFVMYEAGVYLRIMRDAQGLTMEECIIAINRVGFYGSSFLPELYKEYGLSKVELEEDEPHQ